ncbi:hypothetical protein [Lutispora thermophila]|uniref:Uncharacterized protein n=1 Tax=Lutispora thermophila DSM 19022 TaxID=1122184 RepID=A0A1M6HYU4_9FIRM|nr:hypothetical protein [Lutispora thermophila]SHJ27313.1 hypothetical protein SAMN02745176_02995 [Lutispora thermophila DSM 19022]
MYKKIYSKSICMGFIWGIFSWISFFKHNDIPSLISSVPVFLSIGIGKVIIDKNSMLFDKSIFILTILLGGFIGFIVASLINLIISAIQED